MQSLEAAMEQLGSAMCNKGMGSDELGSCSDAAYAAVMGLQRRDVALVNKLTECVKLSPQPLS